jgi:hypothetical protein
MASAVGSTALVVTDRPASSFIPFAENEAQPIVYFSADFLLDCFRLFFSRGFAPVPPGEHGISSG